MVQPNTMASLSSSASINETLVKASLLNIVSRNLEELSSYPSNTLHALENRIGEHLGMSFLRLEDNSNACHQESSKTSYDSLHPCCLAVS